MSLRQKWRSDGLCTAISHRFAEFSILNEVVQIKFLSAVSRTRERSIRLEGRKAEFRCNRKQRLAQAEEQPFVASGKIMKQTGQVNVRL